MSINISFELDSDKVKKSILLGNGAFGLVYKGVYFDPDDPKIVAIKTSKDDDEQHCQKLLQEASILQNLQHDNILTTYGVCTRPTTMLVMEFAEFGELGEYLKINQTQLDSQLLLLYMYQISTALVYLEFKHCIHRDIAARNVLVLNPRCVKLADFGFARYLKDDVYVGKYYKLPIKWMSPESIKYYTFSIASDVWMFGVCMWEIMMYGVTPYRGISTQETITRILSKKILEIPDEYPTRLKRLVRTCWSYQTSGRPKPQQLEEELRNIYINPQEDEVDLIYQNAPPKPPRVKTNNLVFSTNGRKVDRAISSEGVNWVSSNFYKPKQSESDKYNSFHEIYQELGPSDNVNMREIGKIANRVYDSPTVGNLKEILEKQLKDSEEDAKWLEECEKQFAFT